MNVKFNCLFYTLDLWVDRFDNLNAVAIFGGPRVTSFDDEIATNNFDIRARLCGSSISFGARGKLSLDRV